LRGDQDAALSSAGAIPRLRHLWLDAGYRGEDKGADWVQKMLGWSVDLLERPRKAAPEEVLRAWAREWAKEGMKVDWEKLMPPKGFQVLPRRWVVERTFSWIDHNRRMSLGTTRGSYVRAGKRWYMLP
jgi:transposase